MEDCCPEVLATSILQQNGKKDKLEGIFNGSMPSSQAQQSEVEAAVFSILLWERKGKHGT